MAAFGVWIAYPLIIFFGLKFLTPRYVALLLALLLLVKWRRDAHVWLKSLANINVAIFFMLLTVILLTFVLNSEYLLRLYPALVNLGMLVLFGASLLFPPSMIESFARLKSPDLSPEGVQYTNTVTKIWCLFFIANGAISLYTAYFCSQHVWALYNGLIAYVLMGILFAGEWLVRPKQLASTTKE